ncbi:MAG: tetratricopeptide repeat protein [Chloroflexi bacterium]|nr:tetratricopeptide repeat protein [Chloroflexota bacterium]
MLEIFLLGEIRVRLYGTPVIQIRSQKEIALLAYLAHTGQAHNREALADLLWEARSTRQSLSNLRTVLARLRQQVGEHLIVTPKTVAVTRAVHEQLDTVRFQTMLAGMGKERTITAVNLLSQGLKLYSGEFMAGFSVPDAPRFDDWLVVEQERLRQTAMRGYRQLARWQEEQGAFADGVITAQQWVSWDPLDETAQQQLMRLLAYDGRISEALNVYEKCRHLLQTELGITPAPSTIALYQTIQAGSLSPPDITPAPLHNLPRALTPLYGRKKEIEQLTQVLLNPEYPLVSITGVGGMGKTSLALAAGRQLAAAPPPLFQDGIWFVSLEEIENDTPEKVGDRVAALVGRAMGLYFHGESDLWSQLLGQLAAKKLLLILDNIEQFLTIASDLIVDLLEAGENIHLLTTSRTTLALAASVAFPLTGLETPAQVSTEALQNESVRLFAERAARMPTPFQLEKHLAEVVAICQFVEGMPLAIELAAAALGRLMMDEIMPALTGNLHLLDTTRHDLPPRQRTLQAVFDTTWQLLDSREQILLAQISIFRGGFTRPAAAAVLKDANSGLYILQHHALLGRDETGRFKMHPLIRQLAGEQRANFPDTAALFQDSLDSHSRYYLQMMGQQAQILQRGAPSQLLATLQLEQHNLRAAWQQAVRQAAWADIAQNLEGIQHYYYRSGLFRDGIELITQALATAVATDVPPQLIPSLHQARAALLEPISQFDQALADIKQALCQETVSQQTQIRAYLVWGLVLDGQGDYQGSLAQYQTAVDLLQDSDEWLLLARGKQGIGWALIQMGQTEAASEPLQQALECSQRADDQFGQMMTLTFLGVQARRRNKLIVCERYYKQALDIARPLGDRLVEGKLLSNLGVAASMRFALSQAQRYLEQALTIFEQLNVPKNRAITEGDLGVVYARIGNYARAQRLLEQSLALARQIGDRYGEAWGLNWLSGVVLAQGDATTALQLAREAFSVAEAIGIKSLQAGGLAKMGDALLAHGELAEAADCYHQAQIICAQINQEAEASLMLAGLADIALRQQQPERALTHVETVLTTIATEPEICQGIHLQVYWVCYQVLQNLGDPRAAAVLAAGHGILMSRADHIDDKAARQLFLTQVAAHQQILEAITHNL